jgi:hypothetical protein
MRARGRVRSQIVTRSIEKPPRQRWGLPRGMREEESESSALGGKRVGGDGDVTPGDSSCSASVILETGGTEPGLHAYPGGPGQRSCERCEHFKMATGCGGGRCESSRLVRRRHSRRATCADHPGKGGGYHVFPVHPTVQGIHPPADCCSPFPVRRPVAWSDRTASER